MTIVFIIGMSGTGTSTVIEALTARGYRAVDHDEPTGSKYNDDGDWRWRKDRVEELLDENKALIFGSGCPTNQVKFYPRFDAIILLSAPKDVITERLRTRTNNSYGKSPKELAEVLGYLDTVEPRLREVADVEIDTRAPVDDVVDAVLRAINRGAANLGR